MNPHLFVYGSLMSTAGHRMGARLRGRGPAGRRGHDPGPALSRELVSGRRRERRPLSSGCTARSTRWAIPSRTLAWLDAYEGIVPGSEEASEYRRVERPVRLASGEEITAWVYLYQKDVAGFTLVPDGRWTAERRASESGLAFTRALGTIRQMTICAGRNRRPASGRSARVEPLSRGLRRLEARPGGPSGPRPRARSTGTSPGTRCSTPTPASTAAGSSGAECNTAWNCLDRHVERGRGPAEGADLRQPRHQDDARLHLRRAARRGGDAGRRAAGPGRAEGRPGHHLHADGARGGDGHARLRAHRRHPFRGVRRVRRAGAGDPHRRLQAGGHPVGLLRHRAGPHRALQAAARRRHRARHAQAQDGPHAAAADVGSDHDRRARPRLGERGGRRQGARPQGRVRLGARPPTRSTSSTPRAPPASPRAWSATTAGTWWRSSGP